MIICDFFGFTEYLCNLLMRGGQKESMGAFGERRTLLGIVVVGGVQLSQGKE